MRLFRLFFGFLILTSFTHAQINVKGRIDHIVPDGTDTIGNIYLTVTGGTSPYTYTWTPGGSNVKDLTNATANSYSVLVNDNATNAITYKYKLGYKTKWTNFISCFLRNDTLFGQTNSPYYPYGGLNTSISKTTLKAGQDGWVQWVAGPTTFQIMLGFIDSAAVGGTGLYSDIDYGIYQNGVNFWRIVGGTQSTFTTVASGDVIRMERVGTTLTYYKNGVSLISYTVSTAKDWKLKIGLYGSYSNANIGVNFQDTTSSNFPNYVEDIPHIVHCSPGSSNGSVKLSPRISGSTHNYTWSPGGSTTSSITSLGIGNYSVDIKDSDSNLSKYNYNVGYKTYWTNFYFTKVQNDTLMTLTPASQTSWSTMLSKNTLTASANGWVEFVAKSQGYWYMVGFTDSASVIPGIYSDIDYGVYMLQGRIYRVISGVTNQLSSFNLGDVIRLERSGSTFYIKINGTSVYSVSCSSSNWKIKTAINGGSLSHVGSSFVDTSGVAFQGYVEDTPLIVHCTPGSNNGSLKLTPSISGASHSYTWSPGGANTSSITSLSVSNYSVSIKDSDTNLSKYTYNVGYKTYWTNCFGTKIRNDSILFGSSASPTGWNTSISKNTLKQGVNGWIEFIPRGYTTTNYLIGFLDSASVIPGVYSDIDFGAYISNSAIYKAVSGVYTLIGGYKIGDIVRVDRTGSILSIKLNGVTINTITANSGINLKIKAAIKNVAIANIGCSFYDSTNVSFPNYIENFAVITNASGEELNTGSIQLFGKTDASLNYTWTPGNITGSIIENKGFGTYTVVSADALGNSSTSKYKINYRPFWTNLSAMSYRNDTLFSIPPYNSSTWSTANSYDSLAPGIDGSIEYIVNRYLTNSCNFGFIDAPSVSGQFTDIDYGFRMNASGNVYRINNGTVVVMSYAKDGDILSLERVGNTLYYKHNGYTVYTNTITTPTNCWKLKMGSYNGSKVTAIGSTLAPIKIQLSKPHAVLKKIPDNGYYMANGGKIYFTFDGEYNSTSLNYNIYDFTHSSVTGCTSLIKNPGDNRYLIDLIGCTSTAMGNMYTLEVTNEKNEKYYLRFMRN